MTAVYACARTGWVSRDGGGALGMKAREGRFVSGLAAAGVVAIVVLVGGAAQSAASTTALCSQGRPFCVAITDGDAPDGKVSLSTATSPHYTKYEVTISRRLDPPSTSKLTNGKATLTLTDLVGTPVPSTAVYQSAASDPRCVAGSGSSSNVLTCSVPNLPAGAAPVIYKPLIFKTPSTAATSTTMKAVVTFKEKGSDSQPTDPQEDKVEVSETTTYEALGDLDVSWAFPTAVITLATSSQDVQFSRFPLTIPPAHGSFTASLEESDDISGSFCPTCFGQIVTTQGGGIFSATNPTELVITQNFLQGGKTKNNIAVSHDPDVGDNEVITASCNVAAGQVPASTALPCRDVTIDHLPGGEVIVTIRVFSAGNGKWGSF